VRSAGDAQAVLDAGADKVSVNSAAVARPELLSEMAEVFGAQCVVLAIDARREEDSPDADRSGAGRAGPLARYGVYVEGGRRPVGRDAIEWAREGVERGAGEILLTSMDRDGTEDGYELELTRAVSDAVDVPVIASGGAGKLEHLVDAVSAGGADAVLCASIFHYGTYSVREAKERMRAAGIPVRL
jgi:cyclase